MGRPTSRFRELLQEAPPVILIRGARGVYTLAVWTVLCGREDEFVALWRELAHWTLTRFPNAQGTLLRDRERPNHFVSFGPWENLEVIQEWRS